MAASTTASKAISLPAAIGLSLALALAGQVVLLQGEQSRWLGVSLYVIAALLFILGLRRAETEAPRFTIGPYAFRSQPPRLTLWITALVLTLLTLQGVLNTQKPPELGRALA